VTASVSQSGERVELCVVDAGPGIPSSERARVFERFHRLEGDVTPGSGLGLAIAKAIVERHRGAISLEDASDDASRPGLAVRVTLPATMPAAFAAPQSAPARREPAALSLP